MPKDKYNLPRQKSSKYANPKKRGTGAARAMVGTGMMRGTVNAIKKYRNRLDKI